MDQRLVEALLGLVDVAQFMMRAGEAGADAFVVICPACFQQLDTNQKKAGTQSNNTFNIPILYLTELYALAFGFDPDELGLKFHRARLSGFLEKFGLKKKE